MTIRSNTHTNYNFEYKKNKKYGIVITQINVGDTCGKCYKYNIILLDLLYALHVLIHNIYGVDTLRIASLERKI